MLLLLGLSGIKRGEYTWWDVRSSVERMTVAYCCRYTPRNHGDTRPSYAALILEIPNICAIATECGQRRLDIHGAATRKNECKKYVVRGTSCRREMPDYLTRQKRSDVRVVNMFPCI